MPVLLPDYPPCIRGYLFGRCRAKQTRYCALLEEKVTADQCGSCEMRQEPIELTVGGQHNEHGNRRRQRE